jgi:hypothetical protein
MHDPIPWLIDAPEAKRRGLAGPGWYVMRYDDQPVVGPCDSPEECVLALKLLAQKERDALARKSGRRRMVGQLIREKRR